MRQARKIKGFKTITWKQVVDQKTMNIGDLIKQAKKTHKKIYQGRRKKSKRWRKEEQSNAKKVSNLTVAGTFLSEYGKSELNSF